MMKPMPLFTRSRRQPVVMIIVFVRIAIDGRASSMIDQIIHRSTRPDDVFLVS
jgi:hypothetical protein